MLGGRLRPRSFLSFLALRLLGNLVASRKKFKTRKKTQRRKTSRTNHRLLIIRAQNDQAVALPMGDLELDIVVVFSGEIDVFRARSLLSLGARRLAVVGVLFVIFLLVRFEPKQTNKQEISFVSKAPDQRTQCCHLRRRSEKRFICQNGKKRRKGVSTVQPLSLKSHLTVQDRSTSRAFLLVRVRIRVIESLLSGSRQRVHTSSAVELAKKKRFIFPITTSKMGSDLD